MTNVHELPVAQRLEACTKLIAGLEEGLADLDRQAGEARQTRAQVALEAREGNGQAKRLLADATRRTVEIATERENVELALAGACERLAGLETEAARERLAGLKRQAVGLCRERAEAAEVLDGAIDLFARAYDAWQALGGKLKGLAATPGAEFLCWPEHLEARLANALPPALRQAFGLPPWVDPDDRGPVAAHDPAPGWLRRIEGVTLEPPPPPAAAPVPATGRPPPSDPHQALEQATVPAGERRAAEDAGDQVVATRFGAFKVVGRHPGGGAIVQRV